MAEQVKAPAWHRRHDDAVMVEMAPGSFVNLEIAAAQYLVSDVELNAVREEIRAERRKEQPNAA